MVFLMKCSFCLLCDYFMTFKKFRFLNYGECNYRALVYCVFFVVVLCVMKEL